MNIPQQIHSAIAIRLGIVGLLLFRLALLFAQLLGVQSIDLVVLQTLRLPLGALAQQTLRVALVRCFKLTLQSKLAGLQ